MATSAEIALAAFGLINSVRVLAYVPQIVTIASDRTGAAGVSCTTWSLFALSHLSTVAYAVLTLDDWRMAAVFTANAVCCFIILGMAFLRRRQAAARRARASAIPAVP